MTIPVDHLDGWCVGFVWCGYDYPEWVRGFPDHYRARRALIAILRERRERELAEGDSGCRTCQEHSTEAVTEAVAHREEAGGEEFEVDGDRWFINDGFAYSDAEGGERKP